MGCPYLLSRKSSFSFKMKEKEKHSRKKLMKIPYGCLIRLLSFPPYSSWPSSSLPPSFSFTQSQLIIFCPQLVYILIVKLRQGHVSPNVQSGDSSFWASHEAKWVCLQCGATLRCPSSRPQRSRSGRPQCQSRGPGKRQQDTQGQWRSSWVRAGPAHKTSKTQLLDSRGRMQVHAHVHTPTYMRCVSQGGVMEEPTL